MEVSLGTAKGTVRIEYESVGVDRAVSDFEKLRETQASQGSAMAAWANQVGVSSNELKRFNEIQRAYIDSQKVAMGFEQRLTAMRQTGTASMKDLAQAQALAQNARRGVLDLQNLMGSTAVKVEQDMSTAGQRAAQNFMNAQLATSTTLSHRNARAMSAEIQRTLLASGVPGGAQAGRLVGTAMGGGLLAGVSASTALIGGLVVAAAAAAAVAVTSLVKTLQLGLQDLVSTQDAVATLNAIGTSGEKINGILKVTNEVAEGTRYSLDEMATAAQTAFVSGIDSAQSLTLFLKTVADAASVSHKPFATMAFMLQQMKDTGKLSSREIRQLASVGPVLDWVAEKLGKTRQATMKLANGAGIDFQVIEEAIEAHIGGASKHMGGLSEESARLKKSVQDLGAALLRPLFGENLTSADVFSKAIAAVREKIDGLVKYVEAHRNGLVDIWAGVGKVILGIGFAVTNVGGVIMGVIAIVKTGIWDMLGALARGVANLLRGLANVQDFFGADGAARDARKSADAISHWGDTMLDTAGSLIPVAGKIFSFNKTLKDSWGAINQWADGAKNAKEAVGDLGSGSATKEMITITDALEKIGVSEEEFSKGITGNAEEYEKFLETLKKKGAPEEVISTIKRLRSEFENGGRAAMNLSKALKAFGDSSLDAASRTKNLISALKEMGILPGQAEDALSSLNEEIDKLTGYDSKLVDMLDRTGEALIAANGHIDTTTKNGRALKGAFDDLLQKGGEAVASGQDPSQVWREMHDTMLIVLRDFGIQGEAAEKLINTYLLPEHDFTINFSTKNKDDVQAELTSLLNQINERKKKGDNNLDFKIGVTGDPNDLKAVVESYGLVWKEYDESSKTATIALPAGTDVTKLKDALEKDLNKNPAEIESNIKILQTRQQIVDQATGGNPLKIPAVLDFTPGVSGGLNSGGSSGIGGSAGSPIVIQGGQVTVQSPNVTNLPAPGQNPMSPNVPPIAPWDQGGNPPIVLQPGQSAPLRGSPGQGFPLPWNLPALNGPSGASPTDALTGQADQARASGQAFAQAYADGIRDRIPEVLQAALEMATASTDPLGHSPAKVGPLAGSGWTYFRGRSYSEAYAQGIASGQQAITAAAMGAAGASGDPLTDSFAKLLKDANEWSSFAQHIFDFASKLTDITYNVLNLVQTISGGRAFPKMYQQDPMALAAAQNRRDKQAAADAAKGAISPANAGFTGAVTPPQPLPPNASKQQIANYIMDKARSEGYSYEQAKAFVVQAVGESGLDPLANGGNQNGSGDVRGIFQFTPDTWGNRPGSVTDAKANIDAYFDLARQRGLTPASMTSGQQLGTQVSKGGPWNPLNTGALDKALVAAQPYLDAYQAGMPANVGTQGIRPGVLRDYNGLSSGPQVQLAAAVISQLFPGITDIGGARSSGVKGTHDAGLAMDVMIPDWNTPEGKALGDKINQYIQQNAAALGVKYSIWNAQFNPAGGPSSPYQYQGPDPTQAHRNHIDVQFTGQPGQLPGTLQPVPVTLGPNSISPNATPGGPIDPTQLGLPEKLQQIAATDQMFAESVMASKGAGMGNIEPDKANQYLQHLDAMIADQNALNTPESKAQVSALNQIKDGIMSNYGMKEGPSGLEAAQTLTQNISGLVGDAFGIVDSSLKSIEGAKNIGDTLVRGIGNTEDIYKIVENIQPFIELGAKISQTVSDALGMAAQVAGMAGGASGGADMGGSSAAAAALGAASSIAGIVSQAFEAVNAAIDLGQEAYRIGTKYLGRMLQQWFGLTGSTDVKYLLDTMEGQLKVYSSDNPQMKTTFNTMSRELGVQYPGRSGPANTFYIYQGPGQDPRDTMSDAMFAVKSSGLGAFGYAA